MFKKLFLLTAVILAVNFSQANAANDVSLDANTEEEGVLESYNRAMFSFNNGFNHYVLMPATRAYRTVTTEFVRKRISGIMHNLREPLSVGNYILQGDLKNSGIMLSRFVVNSTLGLLGMFDVAEGWGLTVPTTSFDDTFATWCIPDGPYIVLPFFGASTPRAAVGMGLGFAFDPVYWATLSDAQIKDKVAYSYAALQALVLMDENMDLLNDLEKNSVDFYATMKSAYLQNRKNKGCFINKDASSAASYDFDFGIDEEEEEEIVREVRPIATSEDESNLKPELLIAPANQAPRFSGKPELLVTPY